jgi:hypothetical protein
MRNVATADGRRFGWASWTIFRRPLRLPSAKRSPAWGDQSNCIWSDFAPTDVEAANRNFNTGRLAGAKRLDAQGGNHAGCACVLENWSMEVQNPDATNNVMRLVMDAGSDAPIALDLIDDPPKPSVEGDCK